MAPIFFEGEPVSDAEIKLAMRGFEHDCKEFAGEFYDMNRSEKFRLDWPSQRRFVESEWRTFVEATRALYVERLGHPTTPERNKRQIFIAIVRQAQLAQENERCGIEANTRLQVAADSQQFVGDKAENRKTVEKFGKRPTLRAALKNATATRH